MASVRCQWITGEASYCFSKLFGLLGWIFHADRGNCIFSNHVGAIEIAPILNLATALSYHES